jgi:hypothetical protein
VALAIDTSHALRRPLELAALIAAVETALPEDESSWIEWKSELDLGSAVGAFKTARAILSFANRMPDASEKTCGGLAYFVLGAEPGNVPGTPAIDAADLEQALLKYLGADGPVWSPHYVTHAGVTVLVIIVEAPQWGDPIHALRKTYDKSDDGTVFVRSQARSRPANSADLRMLQERLLRRASGVEELAGLEVTCAISEPEKLLVVDPTDEAVEKWMELRREALVEWQARRVKHRMDKDGPTAFGPSVNHEAIEEHLQQCRGRLFDAQRRRVFESGWSVLSLSVLNPSPRILDDVELTLHVDGQWSATDPNSDEVVEMAQLPDLPKLRNLMGLTARSPFGGSLGVEPIRIPRAPYFNPRIDIEPHAITLQLGQLRPEKPRAAPDFCLILHRMPEPPERFENPLVGDLDVDRWTPAWAA